MTLKEELEILRGEPIKVFTGDPMSIPCIETSDPEKLCKHPVVSVQMITYNHEPYIRQAIEGVMMQKTDFEFELIIGEDCSQDKTREICFEYQKKYPDKIRVLWWHENVRKFGGNSRRCRARCRGEFIALCEGDDYWIDPLKLQKQVDIMRKYPNVGFCFCGAVDFHQTSGVSTNYDIANDVPTGVIFGKDFLEMNLFGRGVPAELKREAFVRTATSMYRVSVLRKAVQQYEILSWRLRLGDVPLWLALSSVADVYYLPDQVAAYRMNNGGACFRLGRGLWKDNILSRIYFLFVQYSKDELKVRNLSLLQRQYFMAVMDSNRKNKIIKSYFRYIWKLRKLDRVSCFIDANIFVVFAVNWMGYLRRDCGVLQPVARFYRKILGHGEYARKSK